MEKNNIAAAFETGNKPAWAQEFKVILDNMRSSLTEAGIGMDYSFKNPDEIEASIRVSKDGATRDFEVRCDGVTAPSIIWNRRSLELCPEISISVPGEPKMGSIPANTISDGENIPKERRTVVLVGEGMSAMPWPAERVPNKNYWRTFPVPANAGDSKAITLFVVGELGKAVREKQYAPKPTFSRGFGCGSLK